MKHILIVIFLLAGCIANAQDDEDFMNMGADTVRVGAYVISVHDINFHEKEYTIRFWLWFLHRNPALDFSKQLDIPNAKTIEFEDPIVDSVENMAWVIMKMKCVMKENWNVKDFP